MFCFKKTSVMHDPLTMRKICETCSFCFEQSPVIHVQTMLGCVSCTRECVCVFVPFYTNKIRGDIVSNLLVATCWLIIPGIQYMILTHKIPHYHLLYFSYAYGKWKYAVMFMVFIILLHMYRCQHNGQFSFGMIAPLIGSRQTHIFFLFTANRKRNNRRYSFPVADKIAWHDQSIHHFFLKQKS